MVPTGSLALAAVLARHSGQCCLQTGMEPVKLHAGSYTYEPPPIHTDTDSDTDTGTHTYTHIHAHTHARRLASVEFAQ